MYRMRENTQVCEICLGLDENVSMQVFPCDCSGAFHPACVKEWEEVSGTCPMCKKPKPVVEEEPEETDDDPDAGRHEASCAEKFLAYSALAAVVSVTVYLVIAAF
jgi:hypothetical protein